MESLPKVCICIPTYNGEAYLDSAIGSAVAQTYPNLEIIISDDCSSDSTVAIATAWQTKSPFPITLLQHERYGLVENWNYCVQYVQTQTPDPAKYLKFLFQDDLLTANCVACMVEVAEQDDQIGLVFSRRSLLYGTSEQIPEPMHWLIDLHKAWANLQPVQAGMELFSDRHFLHQPDNKIGEPTSVLIKINVLTKLGLFDTSLRQFCDLEMWFRIMAYHQVAFINEELATFRIHHASTTNANVAQDRVWAEIYRVWLKLVFHPTYNRIAPKIRSHIYLHLVKSLMREYLSSILHHRWHRLGAIGALMGDACYLAIIPWQDVPSLDS
jgi:glycosyltransferase involved in cell wall biosynthesis